MLLRNKSTIKHWAFSLFFLVNREKVEKISNEQKTILIDFLLIRTITIWWARNVIFNLWCFKLIGYINMRELCQKTDFNQQKYSQIDSLTPSPLSFHKRQVAKANADRKNRQWIHLINVNYAKPYKYATILMGKEPNGVNHMLCWGFFTLL